MLPIKGFADIKLKRLFKKKVALKDMHIKSEICGNKL
jgi:hypothetical protein